jgi:hypothetical protein
MNTAKVLIPNKEWLVTNNDQKIGGLAKNKKGYTFYKNGRELGFKNLNEVKTQLGIALFEESFKRATNNTVDPTVFTIYDYPCRTQPYNPVYNVKNKLPLYTKNLKSKSRYCAGHYVIKFQKGWLKSFCPKLITLERNPYQGPFKTPQEMKLVLNKLNKECDN